MSGYIGSGNVMLDILDDNMASTGYAQPVNAVKFEIASKGADTKERVSRMKATFGQVLDSVGTPNPHEISMEFDDAASNILAMAFNGHFQTFTQAAQTGATVTLTAKKGKWMDLGKLNVSAVVITGKVLGTDYAVEADSGLIHILETGTIVDGASTLVTFNCAAVTGETIFGATKPQIDVMIKFDGINQVDKRREIVTVYHAVLSADSVIDYLANEFAKPVLTGKLITPAGMTHPYRQDRFLAA